MPLHDGGQTWVLSNQWGVYTELFLTELIEVAPEGFSFKAVTVGGALDD